MSIVDHGVLSFPLAHFSIYDFFADSRMDGPQTAAGRTQALLCSNHIAQKGRNESIVDKTRTVSPRCRRHVMRGIVQWKKRYDEACLIHISQSLVCAMQGLRCEQRYKDVVSNCNRDLCSDWVDPATARSIRTRRDASYKPNARRRASTNRLTQLPLSTVFGRQPSLWQLCEPVWLSPLQEQVHSLFYCMQPQASLGDRNLGSPSPCNRTAEGAHDARQPPPAGMLSDQSHRHFKRRGWAHYPSTNNLRRL